MKLATTIAAAAIVAGSAAFAQDAFITQLGDDNLGVNLSGGSGTGGNIQVVAQSGNGQSAINLANDGEDNYAYAYQQNTGESYLYFCGFFCIDVAEARPNESLIWQSQGDENTAVNVQLSAGVFGDGVSELSDTFRAQTIQVGDGNTAVNWQQNESIAGLNYGGTLSAPTLTYEPATLSPPTPIVVATVPFYSGLTVD